MKEHIDKPFVRESLLLFLSNLSCPINKFLEKEKVHQQPTQMLHHK